MTKNAARFLNPMKREAFSDDVYASDSASVDHYAHL